MTAFLDRCGSPSCRVAAVTLSVFVFAVLAIPGCGKKAGGARGGFAFPPMPVETATVTRQTVAERFETVGNLEAAEAVTLVAEISGVVESLPFTEGSPVGRGALIAQLDDDQLIAERDRAAALRTQAKNAYERVKQVVAENAGAPQDLDDAAGALGVAEANLAIAQARLAKSRITSPFAGIVGVRRVSPGAFLNPGDPITVLARVEELRVIFYAPERFMPRLTKGASVTISTSAFPGYELAGRIDAVDPILDESTRSARVMARVGNPEGKFRPGMSANVVVVLSQRENALTLPSEAIFMDGNQPFVFVIKPDSTVTRQALVLGTRLPDAVEVLDGLVENQLAVRTGHQKLFEGAKVMPIPSGGSGRPGTAAPVGGQTGGPAGESGMGGGPDALPATPEDSTAGQEWPRALVPADSGKATGQ
jgi:membrane fusion protein (multidrug efflux system)